MTLAIQIKSIIGLILSIYALYVEKKAEHEKKYVALCDFSKKSSCSKAFKSKWGKMFGVSNSIYGMGFYVFVFFLTFFGYNNYVLYLSILSFLGSVYLAYISYFKIKNFCVVCTS